LKVANSTKITGFVMPVGNGAVGKTSVARVLDSMSKGLHKNSEILQKVRKTNNLEFEYITTQQTIGNIHYIVTLQMLIPPGQKQIEGDSTGRSFESVINIYKPFIRRIDVILFTYDLASRESFHDLVYWVDNIGEIINDATHFILLGTHLDRIGYQEVTNEDIEDGMEYLRGAILDMKPTWKGNCARLEVSNLTGENLQRLLFFITMSVVSSRKIIP
jgi:GTPase SAR1 family protein